MIQLGLLGVNVVALIGGCLENLLEVEFLADVGDVDNSVALELVNSISNGGEVSRSIPKSSI